MPSTVIANFSYDQKRSSLIVQFISGVVYEYINVPLEVFETMKKTFSKGAFLNQHIKGNYDCKKLKG